MQYESCRCRRTTFGHRAFSVAGPMVWNSLPTEFRDLSVSLGVFKHALKTILVTWYQCIQHNRDVRMIFRCINFQYLSWKCDVPYLTWTHCRSSPASQREALLELMWNIWPDLPLYGSKAVQFVDLLGYFTIKTPQTSDRRVSSVTSHVFCLLSLNYIEFIYLYI